MCFAAQSGWFGLLAAEAGIQAVAGPAASVLIVNIACFNICLTFGTSMLQNSLLHTP